MEYYVCQLSKYGKNDYIVSTQEYINEQQSIQVFISSYWLDFLQSNDFRRQIFG